MGSGSDSSEISQMQTFPLKNGEGAFLSPILDFQAQITDLKRGPHTSGSEHQRGFCTLKRDRN